MHKQPEDVDEDNEWEDLVPTRYRRLCKGAELEPIEHPDRSWS